MIHGLSTTASISCDLRDREAFEQVRVQGGRPADVVTDQSRILESPPLDQPCQDAAVNGDAQPLIDPPLGVTEAEEGQR